MTKEKYRKYLNMIKESNLDEAIEFRRNEMPNYIYKFYPLFSEKCMGKVDIRTLKTLKNNMIWCSKFEYLNDPYEARGLYLEGYEEFEKELDDLLRVASFTEDAATNISMWAYYANNHKGFCVKYKVFNKEQLYDVNYIEDRKSLLKVWHAAMMKTYSKNDTEKEQLQIYEKYLVKHMSWNSEKEYRILHCVNGLFEEKGRTVRCEELGIKPVEICVGKECSNSAKKKLQKISRALGCGNIRECKVDRTKFILM